MILGRFHIEFVAGGADAERHNTDKTHRANSGQRRNAVVKLREKLRGFVVRVILEFWIDGHHQDVVGLEANVDRGALPRLRRNRPAVASSTSESATCTMTRALRIRERPARPNRVGPSLSAPTRSGREARRAGTSPNEQRRNQRQAESEGGHAHIDVEVEDHGEGQRKLEVRDGARCGRGQHKADARAGECEHETLNQQLTDELLASGAHGEADGDFFLPAGGARQQDVADIGAGHQQHQANDNHEDRHERECGRGETGDEAARGLQRTGSWCF